MISFSFPTMEIHNSKEPIAIIQFPSRKQKEYKLRVLAGKYFYIRDGPKFEGIFELDPTKAYYSGNTPIYYFDSRNCRPFDWKIGQELVTFAKKNDLTRFKHKDITHSKMLRQVRTTTPDILSSMSQFKDMILGRKKEINDTLDEFNKKVAETTPQQHPPEQTMGYILTNYLLQKNLITQEEKGLIDAKVSRGEMTLDGLIATLREKEVISIAEPFTREEELYLEDYGGYNPTQLTAFVRSLLQLDKGLKTMTSIPLKSWMPAGIIMALLIGGSIAAMVLLNNLGSIGGSLEGLLGFGPPEQTTPPPAPPPILETIIPEPPQETQAPPSNAPETIEIEPQPVQTPEN